MLAGTGRAEAVHARKEQVGRHHDRRGERSGRERRRRVHSEQEGKSVLLAQQTAVQRGVGDAQARRVGAILSLLRVALAVVGRHALDPSSHLCQLGS